MHGNSIAISAGTDVSGYVAAPRVKHPRNHGG